MAPPYCTKCDDSGQVYGTVFFTDDYGNRTHKSEYVTCPSCKGDSTRRREEEADRDLANKIREAEKNSRSNDPDYDFLEE